VTAVSESGCGLRWNLMAALILASMLAAILGFSTHRASVCTVRAVAEVVTSRTGHMLASIGKSVLWVTAVTVPVLLLMPSAGLKFAWWPLTGAAVLGGFVFGMGAAVNGACAYSTMARLVDGEGGMLVTVAAFAFGILVFGALVDWRWLERPLPIPAPVGSPSAWRLALGSALALWALFEAARLWRTRPAGVRIRDLALAAQYRLSSGALLIGLAGAAIFLLYGSASYTGTVQQLVEASRGMRGFPAAERWVLLVAALIGMLLSTVQRGSFRLDWRPRWMWLRNICGGVLMGLGVALTPGGNDALVLYGIPSLSPHALPAFLAMAVGIALGLSVMRTWFGIELRVACRNDVYIAAPPSLAATNPRA
jgi:uncharacterized membrane protein YedE/YeeE